jgi:hypothetical protein
LSATRAIATSTTQSATITTTASFAIGGLELRQLLIVMMPKIVRASSTWPEG